MWCRTQVRVPPAGATVMSAVAHTSAPADEDKDKDKDDGKKPD